MKKQIVTWLALIIIVLAVSQPSPAVAIDKATGSIDSQTIELFDMPLCLPALYVNDPVDCLPIQIHRCIGKGRNHLPDQGVACCQT
jgi:hypothetical protein